PRIGQVENMSVEGLFVHGGDLWRLNTPLSCLQPPQQGKTLIYTVNFEYFLFHHCGVRAATSGYAGSVFFSCALFVPVSASG
ncbi:hypothetical protein L0E52_08510, partial [Klebsiella pneumoniae]|nr:hypothetical protein [Klebsiella pneumoniae]